MRRIAAVTAALALAAGGCGGDKPTGGDRGSAVDTRATAPSNTCDLDRVLRARAAAAEAAWRRAELARIADSPTV
ncbi:MAG: hypothetical protein ACR2L8_03140, partial [Solirubrobacteraceae bacterium]